VNAACVARLDRGRGLWFVGGMDVPSPLLLPDFTRETRARARGCLWVAGVDEAGRGPLAGPVTAAAVILDPDCIPAGLNDSKQLSAARREALFAELMACA